MHTHIHFLMTTLSNAFQVVDLRVVDQVDGSPMALVEVPSEDDARLVISNYHRRKIGYKRILIAIHKPDSPQDPQRLRFVELSL